MIRRAIRADVESISAIYNEAISEGGFTGDLDPLSIENRLAWFSDHQDPYAIFVKTLERSVVGYVALSPYRKGRRAFSETCEISYYLSSEHRGRGIGKELVSHAIDYAEREEFTMIVAVILASNQRSMDLLLKFGFSVSGRLPKAAKIDGEYVDHIYLSRCLDSRSLQARNAMDREAD
jgi:L-amino acid N-acyltransferase